MSNNLLFSINNQNQKPEVRIMNELTKQTAEKFQCNYTIFEQGTDPELAEQAYREALDKGKAGGFWPALICLDEYAVEWLLEVVKEEYDRDEIIAGCGENGKEILEQRFAEYTQECEEEELEDMLGEETEGEELHHFIGYMSFSVSASSIPSLKDI